MKRFRTPPNYERHCFALQSNFHIKDHLDNGPLTALFPPQLEFSTGWMEIFIFYITDFPYNDLLWTFLEVYYMKVYCTQHYFVHSVDIFTLIEDWLNDSSRIASESFWNDTLTSPSPFTTGRWRRPIERNKLNTWGNGVSGKTVNGLGFRKRVTFWKLRGKRERYQLKTDTMTQFSEPIDWKFPSPSVGHWPFPNDVFTFLTDFFWKSCKKNWKFCSTFRKIYWFINGIFIINFKKW